MRSRKDEETSIENRKQDDKGDVRFDAADEDDEDGEAPANEIDTQIGIEAWVIQSLEVVSRWGIRCHDSGYRHKQDRKT